MAMWLRFSMSDIAIWQQLSPARLASISKLPMEEGCQTFYRPVPGPLSSWKAVLLFKQKERAIADAMRPPLLFLYLCVAACS
jgi:hypothetical protein